jgi:hypothetical protein
MTDHLPSRRAMLRGAGLAVGGTAASAAFLKAATPALAAPIDESPVPWVGPSGSGAPYPVDTTVGAQGAINQALTDNPRGAVYIAPGSYVLKGAVVIGDWQTLAGAGPLSTLLTAASTFPSATAMITTASGSNAGRICIHDLALEAAGFAQNGINLQAASTNPTYGPDPQPWIDRVFVSNTTGDGIYLGGTYSGGEREFKVTNCRVEHAGGWAYNLLSTDGFIGACSAQGGTSGGFFLAGANIKAYSCKAYSTGDSASSTPGPAFKVSSRNTLVGCEAQDTHGCGFEVSSHNVTLSGCLADSCGSGTNDRYASGFYLDGGSILLSGSAVQRAAGSGVGAMRRCVNIATGSDYLIVDLVCDAAKQASGLPISSLLGSIGTHSQSRIVAGF